ncbi:MAG: hypothetical protein JW866_04445 [Ignavibacteriales bacterium]|nr:hypothetical protein [Ignavibacteriales bacterium]
MKLTKNLIILFLISLLISTLSYSQERLPNGEYKWKGMSQEDAVRILGPEVFYRRVFKGQGDMRWIKESIINGNKITTVVFNYGSICAPNYLGNVGDLVWQGLGYGFEFGPLAAAEVIGNNGQKLQIVEDSFVRFSPLQGDYSPDGTMKWGWLPKTGYVDNTEGQNEIARLNIGDKDGDGKPDSWPESWYSPGAGKYLWPAFLGEMSTAPDEEVFFVVDDYTDKEFNYTPFPSDPSKGGLGLDMEVRILQFNNPLAEDIIFLVYSVTNASEKELTKSYFGMHGDPHVGGPNDYADDLAGFVDPAGFSLQSGTTFPQRARSMVYAWDDDMKGDFGRTCGYFGWKFLESPSNAEDGIDNDFDGMLDETPFNSAGNFIDGISIPLTYGISDVAVYTAIYGAPKARFMGDEDGDWDPARHDVGIDGIGPDSPNYPGPDYGEGDGFPSQGWYLDVNDNGRYDAGEPIVDDPLTGYKWAGSEPNFGYRDISESDQLGLTSFHAAVYTNTYPNVPANDPLMWEWLSSDSIDPAQELLSAAGDNIFNFGTGPLSLKPGEAQRFSMCILFGDNLADLVLNAETSTRILEADYRFAQPPAKPIVTAIPEDGKVILYWDTKSEESIDPLTGIKDFQGYKIYRSQDYTFSDVFTITDGFGNPFLGKPLAQFDLIDSLVGFHPVEYQGRAVKYYVGDNTGLVHEYVDSTIKNGITYYYAVVAYDGGSNELPPTETQCVISRDPITGKLSYDVNTVQVIPGPVSSGFNEPVIGINGNAQQIKGNSTGDIYIKVFDKLEVNDKFYAIDFINPTTYNVYDSTGVTDEIISKDTVFVTLSKRNIDVNSVVVKDAGGSIVNPSKYFVNELHGKIQGTSPGSLPNGEKFNVNYRYWPVYESKAINYEDVNPAFDGMKIYVKNNKLKLDTLGSKWSDGSNINLDWKVQYSPTITHYLGNPHVNYRADWEIRWNNLDTNADGSWKYPGDKAWAPNNPKPNDTVYCPFTVWNVSENVPGLFIVDQSKMGKKNTRWDWGEDIILRKTNPASFAEVTYCLTIKKLPLDTLTGEDPNLYPAVGDIFTVRTKKPFQTGDKYIFETQAAEFSAEKSKDLLDNIYVVPNPYVAYSDAEQPGRTASMRGDKVLQFRNLPPKCTIRIYTIVGELVATVEKDDFTSMAEWDLLSYEGHRIAYGVYIYHVDVPDVGEKIGRFAVIK